jgi:hypothetical protein
MKHKITLAVVVGLLVVGSAALAQASGSFDLAWNKVSGGGGTSSGGSYELSGTAGQADAGTLSGGGFTVAGGFWGGTTAAAVPYRLYLPLVFKTIAAW